MADEHDIDDDCNKSEKCTFPVVLVPTLKCETLHRDYFQTSGNAAKNPVEQRVPDENPQHVTNKQPSFTSQSSIHPTHQQSQNSSDLFLLHDQCQSHDQIPQPPDCSAEKETRSTSLSDLCRLSPLTLLESKNVLPSYDSDSCNNPGLTQSCHEYYITRHASLNDSQRSHDISQTSLIGGSCSRLSNSELVSCEKSTTYIQQAKKRCIPKVGIRTIPLIKIKPELKFTTKVKDGFTKEVLNEPNTNKGEVSAENKDLSGSQSTETKSEEVTLSTPDYSDIVGEVIVHEYSRDNLSPEDESVDLEINEFPLDSLDASKRELSTIVEENKVINESGSELSLQGEQNFQENSVLIVNEVESLNQKRKGEQKTPDVLDTLKFSLRLLPGYKGSASDDTETANTNDSLFVNKDEDSLNTVTDIGEEEFCTQFSDTEGDQQIGDDCVEDKDSSSSADSDTASEYDNVLEYQCTESNDSRDINVETIKPSKSAVDGITDVDRLERKLKSRTCLSLGRDSKLEYSGTAENIRSADFRNIPSDSEGTLYYSFNSLDNVKLNESCGALSKGSRRLPLKWTPRVLFESRISGLTSGTFSESSFQTADTFGTFYSARSFQLDSCDNFQTCEDLTQYNEETEIKSKFVKAKEAFLRGKDFVKAKLDDYRKRLPTLKSINLGEHNSCQRSCGFSCVHVGKEISQYSLPDTFGIKGSNSFEKGDYSGELKGDYCEEHCCGFEHRNEDDCDEDVRMGKNIGLNDQKDQMIKTGDRKRGPESANTNGMDDGKERQTGKFNRSEAKMTVKMDLTSRETIEDDLPVGSEAMCIPRSKKQSENGDSDGKPLSKRLRWVSAVEKTQGNSMSSSLTSNSSVDQLLSQRQTDPEIMLRSLGFEGGANTDESATRIPERFLLNPCTARGIDIFQFVLEHPELQHLIPACERNQQMHVGMGTGHGQDEVDMATENATPVKGSMQQHHFSSVLQGVRFLHNTQSLGSYPTHSPHYQVPDDEMKEISSIPSVLDFPNRRFLAKQGFYGKKYSSTQKRRTGDEASAHQQQQPKSITAEQRRKQFHHSGRSKNWSLTEDSSETDDSEQTDKSDRPKDSFDEGLMLRSFSERFSSESSLESCESFGDRRDELRRQNSISHLRKQYQDTISRHSMDVGDRDLPVFDSDLGSLQIESDIEESQNNIKKKLTKQPSISDIRKQQVDRLMCAEEDDGDYFAHSLKSSLRDTSLKRSPNSTQSTLTESPVTPKEFKYSFEKNLQDGDDEFTFPPPGEHSRKMLTEQTPAVSIVIDDDCDGEGQIIPVNTSHVQSNPNALSPLHLIKRTDSSNTIVPSDLENSEGDLTPRPGDVSPGLLLLPPDFIDNKLLQVDALSESASSSETWTTVLPNNNVIDSVNSKLLKDADLVQSDALRSEGQQTNNLLRPAVQHPQESFELEEISSGENAIEDINGNTESTKSKMPRGTLEKSFSTHSDSSGFADIDQLADTVPNGELTGETTTNGLESQKGGRRQLKKQKTLDPIMGQDLSGYHDNPLHQTENRERKILGPLSATVNQENSNILVEENLHTKVHICRKENSVQDTENINPSLQSITYIPNNTVKSDKSVVYSITIPMTTSIPKKKPVGAVRYVSSVKLDVDSEGSVVDTDSVRSFQIKQAGPVLHQKLITDLDLGEGHHEGQLEKRDDLDLKLNLEFVNDADYEIEGATSRSKNALEGQIPGPGIELLPSNTDNTVHLNSEDMSADSVKQRILLKRMSKEALIAATSHTADWLLSNERHVQSDLNKRDFAQTLIQSRFRKPVWASTPDLNSRIYEKERIAKSFHSNHIGKSLDIDDVYEEENDEPFNLPVNQKMSLSEQTSLDESVSDISYLRPSSNQNGGRQYHPVCQNGQHFVAQEMRHSFLPPPVHESVPLDNSSYLGSSTGMPDEQVQYLKLAKLVNGPSLILGTNIRMPVVKFTPNIHMKDWTQLPKQKHLEEETRLVQHAVQRYKVELIAMETMLFNMKQIAEQSLNKEERLDVEEMQHLWSEVRKEVNKMEDLLSLRLMAVINGNRNYNPLDAVEIVHSMIQLLREQLYHQQMCIERDTNMDDMEEDEAESMSLGQPSSKSFDPLLSDLSQQMSDIKLSVSQSQLSQKEELKQSLLELKDSILSEVRDEVTSTQNVKMLQLQVQAREEEIKRLKLELLQQNIECGKTRKRQTFESDV